MEFPVGFTTSKSNSGSQVRYGTMVWQKTMTKRVGSLAEGSRRRPKRKKRFVRADRGADGGGGTDRVSGRPRQ